VKLEILDEAGEELHEAIAFYEDLEPRLGLRLKEEARQVIQWIENNAFLARLRPKGYRRVNLKVFPYYIAYFIWDDTIWILAVAHGHRRPEYWLERKKKID
jgi:toxin ParE1/3/4